jgi:hypothetical protein
MANEIVRAFWRDNVRQRRQEARQKGYCAVCIGRKAKPGGSTCQKCLDDAKTRRENKSGKRRRKKAAAA